MKTIHVLLVSASAPGLPAGSAAHRYDVELALDAEGKPDPAAWQDDPEPWRAHRITPDGPAERGDVQYDGDHGWSIRFFGVAAEGPDAPETRLDFGTGRIRPGTLAAVTEPDGTTRDYRVVAVG